jgi:hypothetical protein
MDDLAVPPVGSIHMEQPITVSIQRILQSHLDDEDYICNLRSPVINPKQLSSLRLIYLQGNCPGILASNHNKMHLGIDR